jgi:hypothetical protein
VVLNHMLGIVSLGSKERFCKTGVDDSSTGLVFIERPARVARSGIASSLLFWGGVSPTAMHCCCCCC